MSAEKRLWPPAWMLALLREATASLGKPPINPTTTLDRPWVHSSRSEFGRRCVAAAMVGMHNIDSSDATAAIATAYGSTTGIQCSSGPTPLLSVK